jgi:colanic acid/amylovoran biosynthesis glycosyltransferase
VMGVDPDEFQRSSPHPDRRVVVAVGRLVEKKGFAHLVRAAAEPTLRQTVDVVRIVGDGPLRTVLQNEIERLGLTAMVRLVGPLAPDGVRRELGGAAVLAVPSVIAADGDRDSMPVVIKEALAMEVPVVASDAVGLPEIVRPEFGRLVAPGDPAALAAALADVLSRSQHERAAMGRAGRAHVLTHANLMIETRRLSGLVTA